MKKIALSIAVAFALCLVSVNASAQTYRSTTERFGTTHTNGSNGYQSTTSTDMFGNTTTPRMR